VSTISVEMAPGYRANFTLSAWMPVVPEGVPNVHSLGAVDRPEGIVRAADYDIAGNFHVNDWPEVRPAFAMPRPKDAPDCTHATPPGP
jgi:hypothetical protein